MHWQKKFSNSSVRLLWLSPRAILETPLTVHVQEWGDDWGVPSSFSYSSHKGWSRAGHVWCQGQFAAEVLTGVREHGMHFPRVCVRVTPPCWLWLVSVGPGDGTALGFCPIPTMAPLSRGRPMEWKMKSIPLPKPGCCAESSLTL